MRKPLRGKKVIIVKIRIMVTCKIMLRHEIFPSGLRESVKICKLLPDAVATFPFAALGDKKT